VIDKAVEDYILVLL